MEKTDGVISVKKLLIADSNEDFRIALAQRLEGSYQLLLCGEGNETLKLLRSFQPDLLVLDMELPGLDGVSLIQWAAEEGICPVILATSQYDSPYAVERMKTLGVAYLMRKPCNLRAVAQRLADLAQAPGLCADPLPADTATRVTNLLLELGVHSKRRGFQCLIAAATEMVREPTQQITKSLYPKVAVACDGNCKQVERAMRAAIEEAWNHRDREVWCSRLPLEISGSAKRPSNGAFICAVASRIALEEGRAAAAAARYAG